MADFRFFLIPETTPVVKLGTLSYTSANLATRSIDIYSGTTPRIELATVDLQFSISFEPTEAGATWELYYYDYNNIKKPVELSTSANLWSADNRDNKIYLDVNGEVVPIIVDAIGPYNYSFSVQFTDEKGNVISSIERFEIEAWKSKQRFNITRKSDYMRVTMSTNAQIPIISWYYPYNVTSDIVFISTQEVADIRLNDLDQALLPIGCGFALYVLDLMTGVGDYNYLFNVR